MLTVTATELPRIMQCAGSLSMPVLSSIESDRTDRDEGDAAHWLIQQVFTGRHSLDELCDRAAPNGFFISSQMIENVTPYLDAIDRAGNVEFTSNFTDGAGKWRVNCRADHIVYKDRKIIVSDFKYGWSIVEPENNWTLIAYAIGFVISLNHLSPDFDFLKTVDEIVFRIFQPRPHHPLGRIREHRISANELVELHKHLNAYLSNLPDTLTTGSECRHCPSRVYCPAFNNAQMNAIDVTMLAYNDAISERDLSYVMDELSRAAKIIEQAQKAYSELALHRLKEGRTIPNYIAQNDMTNRVWKDFVTPDVVMSMTGKDVTKKDIVTPSQAEKLGVPKEIVETLSERRNKGFKLVRMDANKAAKKMFNNL